MIMGWTSAETMQLMIQHWLWITQIAISTSPRVSIRAIFYLKSELLEGSPLRAVLRSDSR